MDTITLYDDDQVTVWYRPNGKIIHHQMHKYTYGKSFRDALMAGADAMQKYGANKWLSDDRNNPVVKPEDIEWGNKFWQPKILAAGWKFWAIVQPEQYLAQLRMIKLADQYSKLGVTVHLFTDPEDAMEWLLKQ